MWTFHSEGLPGKCGMRFAVDFDAHPASSQTSYGLAARRRIPLTVQRPVSGRSILRLPLGNTARHGRHADSAV